jgi:hypothetical protein
MTEIIVDGIAEPAITSSEAGRQRKLTGQYESALASIRVSFDPRSNVNVERQRHDLKQSLQRVSTEAGMQIDCNDEQPSNVQAPTVTSFDPNSNAITSRDGNVTAA